MESRGVSCLDAEAEWLAQARSSSQLLRYLRLQAAADGLVGPRLLLSLLVLRELLHLLSDPLACLSSKAAVDLDHKGR